MWEVSYGSLGLPERVFPHALRNREASHGQPWNLRSSIPPHSVSELSHEDLPGFEGGSLGVICQRRRNRSIHFFSFILLFNFFIDYAITVISMFPPLSPSTQHSHSLWPPLPFSSCPWAMHVSSLASPFPVLALNILLPIL